MNITTLTNSALINLQTTFADRDTAIRALADQLDQQGKLHDKEEYLKAVFAREEHGATALGEGLAVPHGKSDAVKEASFAVATLKETVKWQGIDEDEMEDVNLIFLLAIPNAEAGSTHMKILTDLTSALVDDDTREAVLKATSAAQIIALLNGEEVKEEVVDAPTKITALTNNALINLHTTYSDRDTAIKALAEQLYQQGKLHNKEEYLTAVFEREEHGATALGEGLAVPHGKSDAVKEASFAVATLNNTLQWPGMDEDEIEDVNLIFLLAIPNAEAGSTHMKILTDLTSALIDDDTREAVLKATSPEQIIALLDGEEVVDTPTKITALTSPALINLQTTYSDRDTAIKALAEQLYQQGKLHNKEEYLTAVFEREEHGATALGEGLAVPHGKSDAVKEASFAVATLKNTLQWPGMDEDEIEDVNLIFLLAIPNAQAGSTHMKILTDLTSALIDDDTREAVLKATSAQQLIALLDGEEAPQVKVPETKAPTARKAFVESAPVAAAAPENVSFMTKIVRAISKIFS